MNWSSPTWNKKEPLELVFQDERMLDITDRHAQAAI